jgi:hypothetical protein
MKLTDSGVLSNYVATVLQLNETKKLNQIIFRRCYIRDSVRILAQT